MCCAPDLPGLSPCLETKLVRRRLLGWRCMRKAGAEERKEEEKRQKQVLSKNAIKKPNVLHGD